MIWGKHFVWIHIGRTGGYSVDKMCRILAQEDMHLDPLGGEWSRWKRHQTIQQREMETGLDLTTGKAKISNFRRLPSWLVSFAEYKKKNEGLDFSNEELTRGMLKAEYREMEDGSLDSKRVREFHADTMLEYYQMKEMDHWLRTEYLATDFLNVMEQWYPVSDAQYRQVQDVNENGNTYNRNLTARFSPEDIREMYRSCPLWTQLELQLYGDLLVAL